MGVIGFVVLAANLTVAALLYRYRQSDSQAALGLALHAQ